LSQEINKRKNIFRDDCNKEFEMHEFLSKNKTLLKKIVPGDEYANIRFDESCQ